MMVRIACACLWIASFTLGTVAEPTRAMAQAPEPKARESGAGPLDDPNFFPLCVWLQSPSNAGRYKEAGINVFVALWHGPNEDQLTELRRHGMVTVCGQNAFARTRPADPTILAWMHGDEPDNAQAIEGSGGYGPPIAPEKILADFKRIKEIDPSRPVLLNLGQGVAWDGWYGRGVRTNHPEDYEEYVKGCDIASFDIYPACHDHRDVAGKLWMVADGVTRLRRWQGNKPVWNCIECTHISNPKAKATPKQVKAEVWMSLVRGSKGIIYFVHEFKPKFIEAGLLADPAMLAEVTAVNRQIQKLAPLLNSPDLPGLAVRSTADDVPVEAIVKRNQEATYVFAVAMRSGATTAAFHVAGETGEKPVEVLGENRSLSIKEGRFQDAFQPWDVHLYRIPASRSGK